MTKYLDKPDRPGVWMAWYKWMAGDDVLHWEYLCPIPDPPPKQRPAHEASGWRWVCGMVDKHGRRFTGEGAERYWTGHDPDWTDRATQLLGLMVLEELYGAKNSSFHDCGACHELILFGQPQRFPKGTPNEAFSAAFWAAPGVVDE